MKKICIFAFTMLVGLGLKAQTTTKIVKLELPDQYVTYILNLLVEKPYKEVAPMINLIIMQEQYPAKADSAIKHTPDSTTNNKKPKK